MKKVYAVVIVAGLMVGILPSEAQNIWSGPVTTFTKVDLADWTLADNQDIITNNVRITRANSMGIFNIALETEYVKNSSPADTEWAFGTTSEINSLTFQDWQTAVESNPPEMVIKDMVLHLITDDVYIDIKFTSWSVGGNGGGFSYQRSTDNATNTADIEAKNEIRLYPNPSKDFAWISGLAKNTSYSIYNLLGERALEGTISDRQKINIQSIESGIYFLKLENGTILKFRKE